METSIKKLSASPSKEVSNAWFSFHPKANSLIDLIRRYYNRLGQWVNLFGGGLTRYNRLIARIGLIPNLLNLFFRAKLAFERQQTPWLKGVYIGLIALLAMASILLVTKIGAISLIFLNIVSGFIRVALDGIDLLFQTKNWQQAHSQQAWYALLKKISPQREPSIQPINPEKTERQFSLSMARFSSTLIVACLVTLILTLTITNPSLALNLLLTIEAVELGMLALLTYDFLKPSAAHIKPSPPLLEESYTTIMGPLTQRNRNAKGLKKIITPSVGSYKTVQGLNPITVTDNPTLPHQEKEALAAFSLDRPTLLGQF